MLVQQEQPEQPEPSFGHGSSKVKDALLPPKHRPEAIQERSRSAHRWNHGYKGGAHAAAMDALAVTPLEVATYRDFRCPGCARTPQRYDLWECTRCGRAWNVFDTAGKCPWCKQRQLITECEGCHKRFLHSAWRLET
jgi:hypothetical protein